MERRVVQPSDFGVRGSHGGGNTRTDEDQEGVHQYDHRGDLHFARFDLMSEEFGRAAHHQSADEDGDDQEGEVVHPPHSDAAEPAVDLHVEHLHHAAERGLRVVHRVHHMADAAEPMRISLPSIEPRSCAMPISSILGLPPISCGTETKTPAVKAKSITPNIQAANLRRRT